MLYFFNLGFKRIGENKQVEMILMQILKVFVANKLNYGFGGVTGFLEVYINEDRLILI